MSPPCLDVASTIPSISCFLPHEWFRYYRSLSSAENKNSGRITICSNVVLAIEATLISYMILLQVPTRWPKPNLLICCINIEYRGTSQLLQFTNMQLQKSTTGLLILITSSAWLDCDIIIIGFSDAIQIFFSNKVASLWYFIRLLLCATIVIACHKDRLNSISQWRVGIEVFKCVNRKMHLSNSWKKLAYRTTQCDLQHGYVKKHKNCWEVDKNYEFETRVASEKPYSRYGVGMSKWKQMLQKRGLVF